MIRAKMTPVGKGEVKLDALPDPADFRDRLFEPTLIEVPVEIELERWLALNLPVYNQGQEGSCTGFALMTVAHYLLRTRLVVPDHTNVSPRMFYEMAKRYDEWPGEEYEGSSARGAMKGWHKHGVCREELWSYRSDVADRELTNDRAADGMVRPLGAYYRVNHKDLVSLHNAVAEVGVLYVTSMIHNGWLAPDADGMIRRSHRILGGHAFAIVGYNAQGFWVQNSWGPQWGRHGCALVTYDDWLNNAMDAWVARLGVPVRLRTAAATATAISAAVSNRMAQPLENVRPYVISIDRDGTLKPIGTYATSERDIARIFEYEIPRRTKEWRHKRIMLFAGSGLETETEAIRTALNFGTSMTDDEIYPLGFIWRTDFWSVVRKILQEALSRRSPDTIALDPNKEFMLDRLDEALEPLARELYGRLLWQETRDIGRLATKNEQAGVRIFLRHLLRFLRDNPEFEVHMVAHGAGSVFFAPLVQLLAMPADHKVEAGPMKGRSGHGVPLQTCTLWAPASPIEDVRESYLAALAHRGIDRFTVYTLTDQAEQDDDCVDIYHKSFLYLVAHALEKNICIPLLCPEGTPLLGMERHILDDRALNELFISGKAEWVVAPNGYFEGSVNASGARTHIDFVRDEATLLSTIARIKGIREERSYG